MTDLGMANHLPRDKSLRGVGFSQTPEVTILDFVSSVSCSFTPQEVLVYTRQTTDKLLKLEQAFSPNKTT